MATECALKLPLLVGVLVFCGLLAVSERSVACSPPEHVQKYDTAPDSEDTTPPTLSAAEIAVRRAKDPDGVSASCEDLGGYTITVEASDDETERVDLGFNVTLVDGSFPFRVPQGNVFGNQDNGTLNDWFVDEGEAFDGTLEVRVVDRAGNVSDAVLVSASGDEVGCSCSAAGASATGRGWTLPLLLALLMLLARRRLGTSWRTLRAA